ncbi:lysosomal acid phosphatase-like [Panonychus citri]|uniref:lysosomal acid phosphatase-like n=1 Tax=Panonychus citri TaxID=50023 RepID=UPI002307E1A0|nr:lysosomal acid phosphatase-like [Panonychus citri]
MAKGFQCSVFSPSLNIVQNGYTSIPSNETYPNDEYSVSEYWPDGYGQLTIWGKQQLYKLGQSIASKYSTLLPVNPHDVYIQSYDDVPTFESAEILSAGAFPPIDRWIWNEKLLWQPIKINTNPSANDTILGTSIPCEIPTLSNIQTREAYIQLTKAHSNLLAYVAEETGLEDMSIKQFVDLYKIIILEDHANLPRLSWLNQTVWQEMEKFVSDLAYLMYSDNLVQKAIAGPLLAQISKNIESIQQGKDSPKVFIYFTKQPKMISLLTSLLINNTQEIVTKPGAVIGLEIYSNSGKQPYFHLTFNDGEKTEHWKPLAMYGCNLDCPMDHFYRYAQFVSPITGEELCSHSDGQPVTFPPVPRSSSDNSVVPPSAALNSETDVSTDV